MKYLINQEHLRTEEVINLGSKDDIEKAFDAANTVQRTMPLGYVAIVRDALTNKIMRDPRLAAIYKDTKG